MLADLRARFQWVVLDFAPVIPMADVSEVIPYVNGAILVVRNGKTEKDMLAPAMEAIGPKLWGSSDERCSHQRQRLLRILRISQRLDVSSFDLYPVNSRSIRPPKRGSEELQRYPRGRKC